MFINGKWFPLFYFDKDEGAGSASEADAKSTDEKSDKQDKTTDTAKGKDGKDFDPARAQELIDKLRESEKEKEKAIKLLKRQIKQLTTDEDEQSSDKGKSTDNKADKSTGDQSDLAVQLAALTARLDKAEKAQKAAELDTQRAQIAAKYGIPAKLAARLQGETPEAIEADAKEIAAALPAAPGKRSAIGNGGDGNQQSSMKQRIIDKMNGTGPNPFDVTEQKARGGGFISRDE